MTALKWTAQVFSYLFHPLFIVTYVLLLLMWVRPYDFGSSSFSGAVALNDVMLIRVFFSTALLPGLAVIMMKFLGLIETLQMRDKQERIGPYIATGVFYLWIFINIRINPAFPLYFKVFMLGSTIGLFLAFFINLFSKISIHAVAMGGLLGLVFLGLFIADFSNFFFLAQLLILVIGIVGTARLILNAHEPTDIYGGYLIGFLAQLIALYFLT